MIPSGRWHDLANTWPGIFVGSGVGAGGASYKSMNGEYGICLGCGVRIRRFSCSSSVIGYARSVMTTHFLVQGSEPMRAGKNLKFSLFDGMRGKSHFINRYIEPSALTLPDRAVSPRPTA